MTTTTTPTTVWARFVALAEKDPRAAVVYVRSAAPVAADAMIERLSGRSYR